MYRWIANCLNCAGILLTLCAAGLAPHVAAKDFSGVYPQERLERVTQVYGNNIRGVLYQDIPRYLTPGEKAALAEVSLEIPSAQVNNDLFGFAMDLKTGRMNISAPAIAFFDDLAVSFAWYDRFKKDPTRISEYIVRLYSESDYLEPPLKALGVPERAWEQDAFVDDVSQKILTSGIAFLLLHELAHWHHQDRPYDAITPQRAQSQEIAADAYAVDVMRRMQTPPYGMVVWFLMTSMLSDGVARTHPLSEDRLEAIAAALESNPGGFISYENRKTLTVEDIKQLSKDIRFIADNLRD
ncbi:MAG: hypothetical protein VW258_02910 [Thalassolituus sp.]